MIGLIIIGDEILSGRRQDKHLAKAIELLSERGMAVAWAQYVGDDPRRITAILREVRQSGEVVFSFGGIGATPDDHTRACAAQAWETNLTLHPQARELILARCQEMAAHEGQPFDPASEDVQRRLQMGFFPQGAEIIHNPYNRIPGFSMERRVHFVPGFPVMAWPMMAAVLDECHAGLHGLSRQRERSVLVYGGIESRLTPLMISIEARHPGVKVFSLPSVDHPEHGRHIDLGVKGAPEAVDAAFSDLLSGLHSLGASMGPELVR